MLADVPIEIIITATAVASLFVASGINRLARRGVPRGSEIDALVLQFQNAQARSTQHDSALRDRLEKASAAFRATSTELSNLITEIDSEMVSRAQQVQEAQQRLEELRSTEVSMSERVRRLEAIEPEAVRELANVVGSSMNSQDGRSARRDYYLFAAGVVLSTLISVVLSLVFN